MRIKSSMDFGRAIKMARAKRGWSQSDLAEYLGSSQRWISEVENGKTRAELGKVLRCMRMLDITMEAEIGDRNDNPFESPFLKSIKQSHETTSIKANKIILEQYKKELARFTKNLNSGKDFINSSQSFKNTILELSKGNKYQRKLAQEMRETIAKLGQGLHHSQRSNFFNVKNPLLDQKSLFNVDFEKEKSE
jgi:y4mF family transcriptional regulator